MASNEILLFTDSFDENTTEMENALKSVGFELHDVVNIAKNTEVQQEYSSASLIVCHFRKVKSQYLNQIARLVILDPKPVVLFTSDDRSKAIDKAVKIGVNAYIINGFSTDRIKPILEIAVSRFNSHQQIVGELNKTRQQLQDRKIIDKAKGILMRNKQVDEEAAYTMIRKMAMDKSKRMVDIARSIIDVMNVLKT